MLIYTVWSKKIHFANKHSKMQTNQEEPLIKTKAQNPERKKKK